MFDNNSMEPLEPRRRPRPVDAHTDEIAKQHNLYTNDQLTLRGKARVYFADYQQKTEVMRAHDNRISTKMDDRHTVSVMLDLAQSRGWDRIKLTGNETFKREAWVQAQLRGIETEGYRPRQTDRQEFGRRQAAASPVAPAPAAKATPVRREAPKPKEAKGHQEQRAQEKAVWNVVETSGKTARGQDGAKPAQKPTEKPPAAAVAA